MIRNALSLTRTNLSLTSLSSLIANEKYLPIPKFLYGNEMNEIWFRYDNANVFVSNVNVAMFILFAFVECANNTVLALLINDNTNV